MAPSRACGRGGSAASPAELWHREALKAKLDRTCAELKGRAELRAESERGKHERKVAARAAREGSANGRPPKPSSGEPRSEDQVNLTDADSGLMKKSERHEWRQSYNAQAVVDADCSQLVLGCRVSRSASDRRELVADVDAVPSAVGTVECVLADNGCATGARWRSLRPGHGRAGGDGGGGSPSAARLPRGTCRRASGGTHTPIVARPRLRGQVRQAASAP